MSKINVQGPWAVAWFANIAFLYMVGLTGWWWVWVTGNDSVVLWGSTLWTIWFLVQEFAGMRLTDGRTEDGGELAVTLSQTMQWFANMDKHHGGIHALTGFDAVAVATLLLASINVGYTVGYTVTYLHPLLGVGVGCIVGLAIFAMNYTHWLNRRKHG